MSVASEINRIKSNIADAYTEAEAKGATMPATENSDNLAGTIAGISSLSFEIAAEKPVSNIKTNVIYLIPNSGAQTENIYDEWIYVNNAWELIGSTAIDLSQYAKKTEVNSALATKADSDVVKPLFTKIIEDSCGSETLTRYNVLENKRIVFTGGAANDENYDIDRYYPLTPGTLLKIKATADSDYTYQFQRTTSMGSANLVSGPFSGDVDDFVVIPDDAVCLSICRSKTNTTNSVTLFSPIQPKPRTLNLANRLYAAETMSVSRPVDLPQGKAVFCVGFDDYNLDCLGAVQYLAGQGLPSYLALIPNNVTDDWAMARLCYENGGEIVAHSGTVLTNQNQTFELMNDKFVDIPAKIGEAGFPVYGIIRAGGTNQGTENRLLDEFYCRAAGLKYSDYYGESPQYTLGRTSLLDKTVSEWESYLDDLATNGGFCIAFCHHVNGTEKKYKYTETGFKLDDHLKPIMAHAKSLMNNPSYDFEIITINEFVDRYVYKTESFDQGTQSWTHSSDGFVRT